MRSTASIAIFCFAILTPQLARADHDSESDRPRFDMRGNRIQEPTSTNDTETTSTSDTETTSTNDTETTSTSDRETTSTSDTDTTSTDDTQATSTSDTETTSTSDTETTPTSDTETTPTSDTETTPTSDTETTPTSDTETMSTIDTERTSTSDTDRTGTSDNKATSGGGDGDRRASTRHAPDRQAEAGWPVPEIMRQARERAAEAARARQVADGARLMADAMPAAAGDDEPQVGAVGGYTVPRTVTVTYTGNVPVAPDIAPRIAMEVAPATKVRPRILSLSVDPLGLIKGNYGASLARRLSSHAALRFDGQFSRGLDDVAGSSSWRVAVSVPLYLNETFQGPYVEAGVAASHRLLAIGVYQTEPYDLFAVRDYTAGPEIFVGWQRLFENGFHIAVAVGASQDWTASDGRFGVINAVYGSPPVGMLAAAFRTDAETYVRVGYAF